MINQKKSGECPRRGRGLAPNFQKNLPMKANFFPSPQGGEGAGGVVGNETPCSLKARKKRGGQTSVKYAPKNGCETSGMIGKK